MGILNNAINIVNYIDQHQGFFLVLANIVLVIITGIYAHLTNKLSKSSRDMLEITKKQITPEIKISNESLCTSINGKEDSNNIRFNLSFDIYNQSAGSGSISKPIIVLEIRDRRYEINPITEDHELINTDTNHSVIWNNYKTIYKGRTIFLLGGEYKKINLHYEIDYHEQQEAFFTEFKSFLMEDFDSLKYYFNYQDNFGNSHNKEILNINYKGPRDEEFSWNGIE